MHGAKYIKEVATDYVYSTIECLLCTVGLQLSRPQASCCLGHSECSVTAQLEGFVKSVRFIREFEQSSVYKCMSFNYLNTPKSQCVKVYSIYKL